MRVEQALELVCPRLSLRPLGARRPGHGELVGTRLAGARGRRGVGGGTAEAVFFNGPEPRAVAGCLTVGVGGGPAEAVFSNGPEVRVPKDCLRVVTHPSVGRGTAGRVRGTGGPLGRGWTAGGPDAGLVAARAAAAALLGARHRGDVAAVEGGGEGWGGSLTYLFPWPQGHSWRVEVEVEVTGGENVREVPGVVLKVTVAVTEGHVRRKAEKPN